MASMDKPIVLEELVKGDVLSVPLPCVLGREHYELVVGVGNGNYLLQPLYLEPSDDEGSFRFAQRHVLDGNDRVTWPRYTFKRNINSELDEVFGECPLADFLDDHLDLKPYVTVRIPPSKK